MVHPFRLREPHRGGDFRHAIVQSCIIVPLIIWVLEYILVVADAAVAGGQLRITETAEFAHLFGVFLDVRDNYAAITRRYVLGILQAVACDGTHFSDRLTFVQ